MNRQSEAPDDLAVTLEIAPEAFVESSPAPLPTTGTVSGDGIEAALSRTAGTEPTTRAAGGSVLRSVRTRILGLVALLVVAMIVLCAVAVSTTVSLRDRTERIAMIQSTLNARVMALQSSVWSYRLATGGLGDYMGEADEAGPQFVAIDGAHGAVTAEMRAFEDIYAGIGEAVPDQYGSFALSVNEYISRRRAPPCTSRD